MDSQSSYLRDICHVNTKEEGDTFVGIKVDADGVYVSFPVGYDLPKTGEELRQDILNLITVLNNFSNQSIGVMPEHSDEMPNEQQIPVNAYMEIISDYLQRGYFQETETKYAVRNNGKIDWAKTLHTIKPLVNEDGDFLFSKFVIKEKSPNKNQLITLIHKYCVSESFRKIGWLFTSYCPEDALLPYETSICVAELDRKLRGTNNDRNKRLFYAMKKMLEYLNARVEEIDKFGTKNFEYIWEKLIDQVFGAKTIRKEDYFPTTEWKLKFGKDKENSSLEPDTIMLYNGKTYILDAKYYRYGITGLAKDLPQTASISKQITYGEYAKLRHGGKIYNAFVMPFNMNDNPFALTENYVNIGETLATWKEQDVLYSHIQGILVDARYLMYKYTEDTDDDIKRMAKAIEETINRYMTSAEELKSSVNKSDFKVLGEDKSLLRVADRDKTGQNVLDFEDSADVSAQQRLLEDPDFIENLKMLCDSMAKRKIVTRNDIEDNFNKEYVTYNIIHNVIKPWLEKNGYKYDF